MATIQFNGIYWGIEKRTPCFRFPAAPAALIQRAVCVWDNTSSRKDCGRARALNSNRARASHIKGRTITRASQALTHNLFGLTALIMSERYMSCIDLTNINVFNGHCCIPLACLRDWFSSSTYAGFPWQLPNPQARAAFSFPRWSPDRAKLGSETALKKYLRYRNWFWRSKTSFPILKGKYLWCELGFYVTLSTSFSFFPKQ